MLAEKRRLEIVEWGNETGSRTIHELKERFAVTLMTINRDLKKLDEEGRLDVVRGGALAKGTALIETILSQRINFNLEAKQAIAEKALQFIKPGDSIFLDASTTSIILADKLKNLNIDNLTIITYSCVIINNLFPYDKITAISTGGTLLRKFHCYIGPLAESVVSNLRVDKFLFSVGAISINGDLTDSDIQEVNLKKKMIEASNEKLLMVESNKFNKKGLYRIVDLNKIDVLISDGEKSGEKFLEEIKNKGIRKII
jgi:DeoR family fructose operon transcriptional repressor